MCREPRGERRAYRRQYRRPYRRFVDGMDAGDLSMHD
jgi:hypothetical protein